MLLCSSPPFLLLYFEKGNVKSDRKGGLVAFVADIRFGHRGGKKKSGQVFRGREKGDLSLHRLNEDRLGVISKNFGNVSQSVAARMAAVMAALSVRAGHGNAEDDAYLSCHQ